MKQVGGGLNVFSPISPGIRQLSFSYTLPPSAFPLALPIADSVEVFEVLVQEPAATVDGAGLTEVAPVVQQGQSFRRLLSQDAKRNAVVNLTMPAHAGASRSEPSRSSRRCLAARCCWRSASSPGRRRRQRVRASAAANPIDTMIRDLAALDADFERRASPTDAERAAFDAKRSALKAKLTAALAAREARI